MLHPCSTPELLPTASSLNLILDWTPHCYQLITAVRKSHRAIKGFERECRLHLSGWAVVGCCMCPFSSRISIQCNAATRPSLPHLFQRASWPELAFSPISRSLAFCLKPLSHTMTAPFHPPLSSVRRCAALPSSYFQWANQCSPWRGVRILKWFCPMLGHLNPCCSHCVA